MKLIYVELAYSILPLKVVPATALIFYKPCIFTSHSKRLLILVLIWVQLVRLLEDESGPWN